jgi:hypothetical protein
MPKVKISREVDGKATEMEVEDAEVLESDTLATDTQPSKKEDAKTFAQDEVNRLLAKERKSYQVKLDTLQGNYDALQKDIQDREAAAEEKAKAQVETLRKGLPENVAKLLDKLSAQDQLEWLSDPANRAEKKTIPSLPSERTESGANQKGIGTII